MKKLIHMEWLQLWYDPFTMRFSVAMPILSVLSGIALVLSTPFTQGRDFTSLSVYEVISVMMLSLDVLSVMLVVFCAVKLSREFSSGGIRTSLITVPQRKKLMLAKAAEYYAYAAAATVLVSVLAFAIGQFLLGANGMPLAALSNAEIYRLITGSMVMPIFYIGISFCFAFVFQSAGGAIVSSLAVLFLPALLGVISIGLREHTLPLLASSAIHSLAGIAEGAEIMTTATAVIVILAWLIIWHLVGLVRFEHKDY